MPYTRLFFHLVWSTKNRLPLIVSEEESKLYAFLRQKAGELECRVLAVNGWQDHIHVVVEIPPKLSVAELVKRLKGASAHELPDLYWQRGYGALTVSERNLGAAVEYVNRQKEHHANRSYISRFERCDDGEGESRSHVVKEEMEDYVLDEATLF